MALRVALVTGNAVFLDPDRESRESPWAMVLRTRVTRSLRAKITDRKATCKKGARPAGGRAGDRGRDKEDRHFFI
jgi:hypothetical protein